MIESYDRHAISEGNEVLPIILAVVAGAAAQSPSYQATQQENCIIDRLGSGNAIKVAAEGATFIDTGAFSANAGALLSSAPTCMALHGWTAERAQLEARYAIAKLALPSAEAALRRKGLDPVRLRSIYLGLPIAKRIRVLDRTDAAALVATVQKAGLVKSEEDYAAVGRYVGLLNIIDAVPHMVG